MEVTFWAKLHGIKLHENARIPRGCGLSYVGYEWGHPRPICHLIPLNLIARACYRVWLFLKGGYVSDKEKERLYQDGLAEGTKTVKMLWEKIKELEDENFAYLAMLRRLKKLAKEKGEPNG